MVIEDCRAPVFRALLHFVYTDALPEVRGWGAFSLTCSVGTAHVAALRAHRRAARGAMRSCSFQHVAEVAAHVRGLMGCAKTFCASCSSAPPGSRQLSWSSHQSWGSWHSLAWHLLWAGKAVLDLSSRVRPELERFPCSGASACAWRAGMQGAAASGDDTSALMLMSWWLCIHGRSWRARRWTWPWRSTCWSRPTASSCRACAASASAACARRSRCALR